MGDVCSLTDPGVTIDAGGGSGCRENLRSSVCCSLYLVYSPCPCCGILSDVFCLQPSLQTHSLPRVSRNLLLYSLRNPGGEEGGCETHGARVSVCGEERNITRKEVREGVGCVRRVWGYIIQYRVCAFVCVWAGVLGVLTAAESPVEKLLLCFGCCEVLWTTGNLRDVL